MKTVWIIDGAYLFNFGKPHPFDYLKLKNELIRLNGEGIHESYFLNSSNDPAADAQNAFHTWLKSAPPKGPKFRVQLYRLKDLRSTCPQCGAPKLPHRVCGQCGSYKGRTVIEIDEE